MRAQVAVDRSACPSRRDVLLLPALCLCGCARNPQWASGSTAGRVLALTTVGMLRDAVHRVGGQRVEARALMGPGVDPHLYRATPGDMQRISQADILFYIGLELEGRMERVFEKIARVKPVIPVGERIPRHRLLPVAGLPGQYDPHIWFDVTLWTLVVQEIRDALVRIDPRGSDIYRQNTRIYLQELEALHRWVQERMRSIPVKRRVLVTAHDAFGYFGRQYGLEVIGLQGINTASEAGAGDVQRLALLIADRKIRAIFVESSVPGATIEAVQAAVRARGWFVRIGGELFSDAMGAEGTLEGTYVGMIQHNVNRIVEAL